MLSGEELVEASEIIFFENLKAWEVLKTSIYKCFKTPFTKSSLQTYGHAWSSNELGPSIEEGQNFQKVPITDPTASDPERKSTLNIRNNLYGS